MLPHRFSLRALRYSNARPMTVIFSLLSSTVVQNYDISPKKEKNRRQKTTACRQRLALRVHSRRRPVRMHAPTAPGCNPGSVRRRRPHAGECRENGRRASRRSPPVGLHEHPLLDLVGQVKPHGARHVRPAQPVPSNTSSALRADDGRLTLIGGRNHLAYVLLLFAGTKPEQKREQQHSRIISSIRGQIQRKSFRDNTSPSADETVTPRRSRSATARSRHRLRACCPP